MLNVHSKRRTQRTYLIMAIAVIFVLAFGLGIALRALQARPVFASGSVALVQDPESQLVFLAISSDDPLFARDPGEELDVGRCTVGVSEGTALSITIYNGYPGYTCTVQTTIGNQGESAVQLQTVDVDVPPGLAVSTPEYPEGLTLEPSGQVVQRFILRIGPEAAEGSTSTFQIQERFELAE